jgi:hypothetical protein
MLIDYVVAGVIVFLLLLSSYILIKATMGDIEKTKIEIVIDGDTADDELEFAVMTAKNVAEKHFKNCDVYIRGGDFELVEALCRTYGISRKEADGIR